MTFKFFLNGDVLLDGSSVDLHGTLKWSCGRTVVVQGEKPIYIYIYNDYPQDPTMDIAWVGT